MLIPVPRPDWDRIGRRARKLREAQRKARKNPNLKKEDLGQLRTVFEGITLGGPATEHRADETAAELPEEMPWMRQAIEHIWRDMRRTVAPGHGLRFRPILRDGPPSVGKTHLALSLARLTGVPEVSIDIGSHAFQVFGRLPDREIHDSGNCPPWVRGQWARARRWIAWAWARRVM
jgi:SpoVK/Ycf46/Vps4 family AAA+-type ATPase